MLRGSSARSEFCTSLSKVLTLWHFVYVKQRNAPINDHRKFSISGNNSAFSNIMAAQNCLGICWLLLLSCILYKNEKKK